MIKTLEYMNGTVRMIDQTRLPGETVYVECRTGEEVAEAIKNMVVRGAPAIGVAAAMGVSLAAQGIETKDPEIFFRELRRQCDILAASRPTAVNLFWAIERMKRAGEALANGAVSKIKERLKKEAIRIYEEDIAINKAMGRHGRELLRDGATVLTHCNAGALATAGYGTALGVVRAAVEEGKKIRVVADETRPFLQGARLTAWELKEDRIPVKLITDSMAGYFMARGEIDLVLVGADRIAANGDVANKIGTYSLAVLAKEHGLPFYVAAPVSTLDRNLDSGDAIPIEERSREEVTHIGGKQFAPDDIEVAHPAFDVTPNAYIHAIITEKGIIRSPFKENLADL